MKKPSELLSDLAQKELQRSKLLRELQASVKLRELFPGFKNGVIQLQFKSNYPHQYPNGFKIRVKSDSKTSDYISCEDLDHETLELIKPDSIKWGKHLTIRN